MFVVGIILTLCYLVNLSLPLSLPLSLSPSLRPPAYNNAATSPSVRSRNNDLHLGVPHGHTITIGRGVKGARFAEDILDLFEISNSVANVKANFEKTQDGETR